MYVWIEYNTRRLIIKFSKVLQQKRNTIRSVYIFHTVASLHFSCTCNFPWEEIKTSSRRHDDTTTRESTEEQLVIFSWQHAVIWKIHFRTCCEITNSTARHCLSSHFLSQLFQFADAKKKRRRKREKISPWCGLKSRVFRIVYIENHRRGRQNKYERLDNFKTCSVLFFFYPRGHRAARFALALHAMHVETFSGESRQSSMLFMLL